MASLQKTTESDTNPAPPNSGDRALIDPQEATALARLFKVFACDSRLRLLHVLVREGETRVSDLAAAVDMKPQAVSNQLQLLVDRGVLESRRQGASVGYRIVDPCVRILLDHGLCLIACCPEK